MAPPNNSQASEKPKGFLANIKQQIANNKKKSVLLGVMIAVAPVAPIFTVAAGLIIAGTAGKTAYKTHKENKAYKAEHPTPQPTGPQKPKNILGNLRQKIAKNKGKALLVGLAATIFPAGTIIAATIIAGTAVKAGLDSRKENKAFKQQQSGQVPKPEGPKKPKGLFGNLGQKIKKNKGKALLVGVVSSLFPVGTIIAATILAGTAVKAGLDSRKENTAFKQQQATTQTTSPRANTNRFTPKPITPVKTPPNKSQSQSQTR